MLKIFIGFDYRQAITYNVCRFSIERRSSVPVSITPLILDQLPLKRKGLTDFSFSRFLVPYLCGYKGWALFLDADMLCLGDIKSIFDHADPKYAAMVSKNEKTFEWASLILFNNEHPSNSILTPDYIETAEGLHGLKWLAMDQVGNLPPEWNHLVGYDKHNPEAKMIHFTQGIPIFTETEGSPFKTEWMAEAKAMNTVSPWQEIMGRSVHAAPTKDGRLVARLHRDANA